MSDSLENLVDLVRFRMAIPLLDKGDIEKALVLALSAFNMVPCVTYFTFDDEENIDQLSDLLVTYACYVLLSTKSLIERGREFKTTDNAVSYTPPDVSSHLLTVSRELWNNWDSQVNNLKQSDSFYDDFVQE